MVGLMTLTWAWAETALAATVGIINKYAGPIKGHPQAPVSLKRRVHCLRVALRDIPVLQIVQEDGRALAVRFVQLGKRRNDFVHGAASEHHEGGFQSIAFAVERGDYAVKNHRFDVEGAVRLNVEIAELSDDAAAFTIRIEKILSDKSKEPE
jgi:hypothetical protein